jgi:hypothetical protein
MRGYDTNKKECSVLEIVDYAYHKPTDRKNASDT